jgi:hypothetical protein
MYPVDLWYAPITCFFFFATGTRSPVVRAGIRIQKNAIFFLYSFFIGKFRFLFVYNIKVATSAKKQ